MMTGSLVTRGLRAVLVGGAGACGVGAVGTAATVAICIKAANKRRERLQEHANLVESQQKAALKALRIKAKKYKYLLAKVERRLVKQRARANASKAESARLSKALAASEQAHSNQTACESRLKVAVAQLSKQSVQLQDSLSAAQQELLDTQQELEAAQDRMAQLQESCADQASKVEALEVEVLQLQVQAEDSDHAMSEVTACHEAQMASVEQRYNAKVANLEHKHDCLMEKYIQLMHHHNSKLQEQQQSEVLWRAAEEKITVLQQQLEHTEMSRSSASDSTTTMGSSRCCSDSAFSDRCCSHSDCDWSGDDSESHAGNTCGDDAALTPRGELALYEDLIDELSLSTNDIFGGESNNNSDGNSEDEPATVSGVSKRPMFTTGLTAGGANIDMAHVKTVNRFIDALCEEVTCTCIATACQAAGCSSVTPRRLFAAAQHIQHSISKHSSSSEAGAAEDVIKAVHGFAREHSTEAAADSAAEGMRELLGAEGEVDLEDSNALVFAGAVCACSGPLLQLHDMQEVLESVGKLQARCGGGHVHQLVVLYEALQHLGLEWFD